MNFTREEREDLRAEFYERNPGYGKYVAIIGRSGVIHNPGFCTGTWNPLDKAQVDRLLKEGRARLCKKCIGPAGVSEG